MGLVPSMVQPCELGGLRWIAPLTHMCYLRFVPKVKLGDKETCSQI